METNPASNRTGAIALTAAAVALLAVTTGPRSVFGLFISPLNSATGLGIAAISLAVALSQLAWGAAQPFCGILAERYGAARVIFAGGLLAAQAEGAPAPAPAALRDARASPRYWVINAAFFVCGLHVFFVVTHLPGVIELCGLPAGVAGASLAVLGLFNIAGSIAAGLVIQRYSMKRTLAALFAARGIGIALFLAAPKTERIVLAFSVWMGLTYMAVLPPVAGLIGKLFGAARLPTLLGITFVVHQAGAFLGSWLGGVVLEATGSYDLMWILDLALAALATGVSLALREQPRALFKPVPPVYARRSA